MMGRRGQALLLDAFIFLMVVAVVSSILIGISTSSKEDNRIRDYVDQAHRVFLSTTIPDPTGNSSKNITVSELISLEVMQLHKHENRSCFVDWERVNQELSDILIDLLPAGYRFKWTASCGSIAVELQQADVKKSGNIMASSLSTYLSPLDKEMEMTLTVWPSPTI